jgi:hypothetical protein
LAERRRSRPRRARTAARPLVLGTGHRLFADGFAPTTFHLVDTTPTTTGVIIATYRSHPFAGANANAGI